MRSKIPANPRAVSERLAIWAIEARRNGRVERADELICKAWAAYDMPSDGDTVGGAAAMNGNHRTRDPRNA
jgi:hypothetical protein